MPETVYVDLTPGLVDIPDSAWADATTEGVMEILVINLPQGIDTENLSLGQILRQQEPAHALVKSGYFAPEGGFETVAGLIPAKGTLDFFYSIKNAYCREAWPKGDKAYYDALSFFDELEEKTLFRDLHEQVYPPKERLRDRLLGRLATLTK